MLMARDSVSKVWTRSEVWPCLRENSQGLLRALSKQNSIVYPELNPAPGMGFQPFKCTPGEMNGSLGEISVVQMHAAGNSNALSGKCDS